MTRKGIPPEALLEIQNRDWSGLAPDHQDKPDDPAQATATVMDDDSVFPASLFKGDERVPEGMILLKGEDGLGVLMTKKGPAVIPWDLLRELAAAPPPAPSDLEQAFRDAESKGVHHYDITHRDGRYIVFVDGDGLCESGRGKTLESALRQAIAAGRSAGKGTSDE